MTKTFCDICGKTLKNNDNIYILSQCQKKSSRSISSISGNLYYLNCHDVCDRCAKKIKSYIDSIKKENNKE